jgi:prophage regulatory protein
MSTTAPDTPKSGLLRAVTLIGRKAVTPEQAAANKREGRYPRRARDEVKGLLPVSPAWLWRAVRAGTFPAPIKLGGATAWKAEDVHAWIEAQSRASK